jgi:hypothetical protein
MTFYVGMIISKKNIDISTIDIQKKNIVIGFDISPKKYRYIDISAKNTNLFK